MFLTEFWSLLRDLMHDFHSFLCDGERVILDWKISSHQSFKNKSEMEREGAEHKIATELEVGKHTFFTFILFLIFY